ncbi:guanine nucleotide exchange factor for Rab-3A-like [Sitophilus oryzae]|uniref:Guanine nucleotide exchange factor for Rab-3A-like n=1 Tax=Sitophilus oryzae TaxID=7048 RepID=A0A6J2YGX6_SITOR|nr:guanine nucleotide exchange factor for Rab-3A-like [Sitophilus oryzae]XP_030762140.1 guanine nucleotide exchange factor for Rab-3A-like [Sitophilus oryzae]
MSSGLKLNTKSNQHKRVGSTGTTGDESYSSDEEDNVEIEPDITIRDHVTRKLFQDREISDKVRGFGINDRNSSDSSMYSDLDLEKCDLEVISSFDLKDDSDSKSGASGSDQVDWSGSVVPCKDQILVGLQEELKQATRQLKLKDEELARVNRIRQDVEAELEDLTASLFQEAHNMVREANEKQAAAEKALKENQMKVDVLTAEVTALKTLVLTSTPSSPNPHLHPQISKDEAGVPKKHRRSPSHYNLKYGRENSPPDSPVKDNSVALLPGTDCESKEILEVDPVVHKEFLVWRQNPVLDKNDPFVRRAYQEDIDICLTFSNKELSDKVLNAVETGAVLIEAVGDRSKIMFPKTCALMQVPRICFYRMNIGDSDDWYSISQICRNRIIAVCDFLNYLKYIQRGLVKSSSHDVYLEITRLRKNMSLARLGLELGT